MYVTYYVFKTGDSDILVTDYSANFIDAPSECQWIVPGTVDPRDD